MNTGALDVMLNQIPYYNRARVKDDITRLMTNVKTLVPKLGILSEYLTFAFDFMVAVKFRMKLNTQ